MGILSSVLGLFGIGVRERPQGARLFPGGALPPLPAWPAGIELLVNRGYAVAYSHQTRGPVVAFECLTPATIADALDEVREPDFHEDPRLDPSARVVDAEYRGTGWDQGHLAPAADMPGAREMYESFHLTNCIPQAPNLNRVEWRGLEERVRAHARGMRSGGVYVITGVVHSRWGLGAWLRAKLGRGVWVPRGFWKIVYEPATGYAVGYYADNRDAARVRVISCREVRKLAGFDPLAAVPDARK